MRGIAKVISLKTSNNPLEKYSINYIIKTFKNK